MGRYIRSEDTLKKLKENRTGKCRGENNAMASKENREKVGNSKVGRKRFYNKNTGQKIYQYPEKIDKNVWCSPEEYKKLK